MGGPELRVTPDCLKKTFLEQYRIGLVIGFEKFLVGSHLGQELSYSVVAAHGYELWVRVDSIHYCRWLFREYALPGQPSKPVLWQGEFDTYDPQVSIEIAYWQGVLSVRESYQNIQFVTLPNVPPATSRSAFAIGMAGGLSTIAKAQFRSFEVRYGF